MELLYEIFRVILDHTDFFQNDLFFFFDFFGCKTRMVEQVGEEFERVLQMLIQHLHVIGRRLTRGEGIHLSTKRVDFT